MKSKRHPVFLSNRGFSLIEIVIAIGIMAGVMAMIAGFLGNQPVNLMREESKNLLRMIRYSYFQAATTSQYYRIVFDFDKNSYHLESSKEPFLIVLPEDEKEELRRRNEEEEKSSALEDEEVSSKTTTFSEIEDDILQVFKLPEGIEWKDIQTTHDAEPVESGKAHLYFFPQGQTEFAVIHLGDLDDEKFFTLAVTPLTGIVEIRDTYVEYGDLLEEYGGQR